MTYIDPSNPSAQHLLFTMASQSPLVKDRVERELYRVTADSDGSDDRYILEDAFQQYLIDLGNIGLHFTFDLTDYTGNWTRLEQFLQLTSYLLPASLYPRLQVDSSLRDLVQHCLSGTLGTDETLIHTYLSELGGLDGQLPLAPQFNNLIDELYVQVSQTEVFTDYLRNQLDLLNDAQIHQPMDADRHTQYRLFLKDTLGRLIDAISLFRHYPFYTDLEKLSQRVVQDFLSPTNALEYSYLFLESRDTLPSDVAERHDAKRYHYQVSHPWNVAYYTARRLTPDMRQIRILIRCVMYALWAHSSSEYDAIIAESPCIGSDDTADSLITGLYLSTVQKEVP